jgi:hypothetical protein
MEVTNAYMYTVKSLPQMFEAIQRAQVPPRFTHDFLRTLGFKSTNDRSFINVLKGLGFLDANSVPTQAYRDYRDKKAAGGVLAKQLRQGLSRSIPCRRERPRAEGRGPQGEVRHPYGQG